MIRKITRGTGTITSGKDLTISCSITDTNKVIVLLDVDGIGGSRTSSNSLNAVAAPGVYLKSVSTSKIIVCGTVYVVGVTYSGSADLIATSVKFSYQIIEFM